MSRTYTLSPTGIYGGRTTNRNLYMSTMQPWADGKRVGCWKQGSTEYYGAVSFFFNFGPVIGKTIQSIVLTPVCSSTFAWSEEVIYNQKSTDSVTEWTIPSYASEVTVEKYGVIPPLDVTAFGIPFSDAYVIGGYYRTYAYADITGATLTVVTAETTKTVSYNANGGSGAPSPTTLWGETVWDGYLSSTVPTRTGYSFSGWNTQANGSGTAYESGAYISVSADTTLYAQWTALSSVINTASNANITEKTTVTWTNYGNFTNKIRFVFGAVDSGEIAVSGTSYQYTLPSSWYAQVPNTTSGTATVYLYTYTGGTLIGTSSKTFTASVKSTIVPSIGSVTATAVNPQWNLYLQKYSKATIAASGCSAGQGASIAAYTITGANLNYAVNSSAASVSATSDTFTAAGTFTYTVTIIDSRGRTATMTVSITVTAYAEPSISSVEGVRCDSDGTVNQTTGTSMKATAVFEFSAVGSNSLTRTLSYKKHTDSNFTTAQTGIVSGTPYVIAIGITDISFSYDVKVEISDSLGNSASYVTIVPPVVGIAFGLKNDRARFGGPCEKPGLQIDWDVDITQRRCYTTLSSAGWYRVLKTADNSGTVIDFYIGRPYRSSPAEAHKISFFCVGGGKSAFLNETSDTNTLLVDKIRCTYGGGFMYFDVHYDSSSSNEVLVYFDVYGNGQANGTSVSMGLTSVVDSPSGETVLTTHNFVSDNSPVGVTNSSSLLTSGTIASSGSMSYTATVPCWVYLMFIMQANSSGSINVQIDNVNIINWSSGEAVPVNFSFLPIPLMAGNTLYVSQSSNRASTYSIFAMR